MTLEGGQVLSFQVSPMVEVKIQVMAMRQLVLVSPQLKQYNSTDVFHTYKYVQQ